MASTSIHKKNDRELINSGLFTLMMFGVSSTMIFAALTSAYIVRRAEGNWLEFEIPNLFITSTIIILLSSATIQLAYSFLNKGNKKATILLTSISLVLGIAFMISQLYAWGELVDMKVFFGGSSANAAGSFMYVLTGVHMAHIISAIIYLLIIYAKTILNKITNINSIVFKTCAIYWHFLGVVWILLYIFLIIKH